MALKENKDDSSSERSTSSDDGILISPLSKSASTTPTPNPPIAESGFSSSSTDSSDSDEEESNGKSVSTRKRPAQTLVSKSNVKSVSMEIDLNSVVNNVFQGDKELEKYAIKCGIEAADEMTRAELDKKRRKLLVAKLEYFVEKTKLTLKQAEIAFEAAKADH